MALRYQTNKLSFLEVDVNQYDSLCKVLKVSSGGGIAGNLPTLVMYEDGREVLRFPFAADEKNNDLKSVNYKEKELVKYFDLDKRHLATRDAGVEKKRAAT